MLSDGLASSLVVLPDCCVGPAKKAFTSILENKANESWPVMGFKQMLTLVINSKTMNYLLCKLKLKSGIKDAWEQSPKRSSHMSISSVHTRIS